MLLCVQTKRHGVMYVCFINEIGSNFTRVAAAAELFLERDHGGKEDFIQIQICRRQHSRRISPDHVVCPKLVRIEVVNHLFSGINAAVNANAIGGHILVVKGSARPGRVAIIGLSALYPNAL